MTVIAIGGGGLISMTSVNARCISLKMFDIFIVTICCLLLCYINLINLVIHRSAIKKLHGIFLLVHIDLSHNSYILIMLTVLYDVIFSSSKNRIYYKFFTSS